MRSEAAYREDDEQAMLAGEAERAADLIERGCDGLTRLKDQLIVSRYVGELRILARRYRENMVTGQ